MVEGNIIRKKRKDLGFTMKELADKCGCTAQAIGQYERSERKPTYRIGKRLFNTLGISYEQAYGEEENYMDTQETVSKNRAVRNLIMDIINEAMEKRDRYVTINFNKGQPFVTIYPLTDDETE